MKYLNLILILITGTLVSCADNDTEGVSSVTNYPIITINGPSEVILDQGDDYTDGGAVSMEGDTEIETTTSYGGGTYFFAPFSTDEPDKYTITYSAVNQDGFAGSALKTVIVKPTSGDLVNDISGLYIMDVLRNNGAGGNGFKYLYIVKTGANTYKASDAIGGYYDIRAGYGAAYAARFTITANDIGSNDFSIDPAYTIGWGSAYSFTPTNFTVDAATKTITYLTVASFGATFAVTLTQVQ